MHMNITVTIGVGDVDRLPGPSDPGLDLTRVHRQHGHVCVGRSDLAVAGRQALQQCDCMRTVGRRIGVAPTASLYRRQPPQCVAFAKHITDLAS